MASDFTKSSDNKSDNKRGQIADSDYRRMLRRARMIWSKSVLVTMTGAFLSALLSGCGLVSSSYIVSTPDPRNPIDTSATFWFGIPQDETLEERLVRYKVETAMKSRGLKFTPNMSESKYLVAITVKDSRHEETRSSTVTNVVPYPTANGTSALILSTQSPQTRVLYARNIYLSVGLTAEYERFLKSGQTPSTLWEGRIGMNLRAFDTYADKGLTELFSRFPNASEGYFTLGPRVW